MLSEDAKGVETATSYRIVSIAGNYDGIDCKDLKIVAEGPDKNQVEMNVELGEKFFEASNMDPVWFQNFEVRGFEPSRPKFANVDEIIGIPLSEARVEGIKTKTLDRWRSKISSCSELLNDVFYFPDKETATLFVSSWIADGARVILRGVPGTGKTTLIEAASLLFMGDYGRYHDAQMYFRNMFLREHPNERCSCDRGVVEGVPFKDCCGKTGFGWYKVGDKAQTKFGAKEYLNMYRKHWARCPKCNRPATLNDVVATRPARNTGALVHYFLCRNPNCPGRDEPFLVRLKDQIGKIIGDNVDVKPDVAKEWGYDDNKDRFKDEESAERYVLYLRDVVDPEGDKKVCESPQDYDIIEDTGLSMTIKNKATGKEFTWEGRTFYQVEDASSPRGWVVRRYSFSEGFYFQRENYEPLLGVAKITPKKRPEEIFYYTEIEKEVVSVDQGSVKARERFVMPPKARPIVKANVKFFNEANRCKPEVQDEVLGLLEEGEVEYKGVSFYSNSPFIAFFDLNPHKEQKETVLDWAFYDRLDLEVVLPTINFGNKVEILTGEGLNIRQVIFEQIMSDYCLACGELIFRGEKKCPSCGRAEIAKGIEPLLITELDSIRKRVKEDVTVSDEAYFALSIFSDLYGRCYYRYATDHPVMKMRAEERGSKAASEDPFVDISTVQWWNEWKSGEVKGVDVKESMTAAKRGGQNKEKLFMWCEGGGIERPLGFRVCGSLLKIAKARAWFEVMRTKIRTGPRASAPVPECLPRMEAIMTTKDELIAMKNARIEELKRMGWDPRSIRQEIQKMKPQTFYRWLECPHCGREIPANPATGNPYGKDERYTCPCDYSFYPYFQVRLQPEDIVQVFPYVASMRFCADYYGNFIPNEVVQRYPNVVDWLKDEVGRLWKDKEWSGARGIINMVTEHFNEAYNTCARATLSPSERERLATGQMSAEALEKAASNYPFFGQAVAFVAAQCGEKGFAPRWHGEQVEETKKVAGQEKVVKEFGLPGTTKAGRWKNAWDLPMTKRKKKKKGK